MKYTFLALILVLSFSCKKTPEELHKSFVPPAPGEIIGKGLDMDAIIAKRGSVLPEACSIIPAQFIAEVLGVPESGLTIKDSSPRDETASHNSCFFKWEDPNFVNAGILLQGYINPVSDEYPDFIVEFIDSKRELGENTLEGVQDLFKTFEGFGDDGAYSTVSGRYCWRLGNKVVLSISFNTAHTPKEQYRIATILAKAFTENYIAGKDK